VWRKLTQTPPTANLGQTLQFSIAQNNTFAPSKQLLWSMLLTNKFRKKTSGLSAQVYKISKCSNSSSSATLKKCTCSPFCSLLFTPLATADCEQLNQQPRGVLKSNREMKWDQTSSSSPHSKYQSSERHC